MKRLKAAITLILVLGLVCPAQVVCAPGIEDNLVRISLDIFPKLVAVDLGMKDKLTDDQKVRFHVVYGKKRELAQEVADHLEEAFPRVAGCPTEVILGNTLPSEVPTAILLVERLDEGVLKQFVEYGVTNHILIFSPFKEDVDRGVTAGMYMAIRILPYFNRDTLNRSQIKMHEILLRSAKFYE